MLNVDLFTDGACKDNPGPGGWGVVLRSVEGVRELSGFESRTTNNRMELTAAIKGLEAVPPRARVRLFTDSRYLQQGITVWIANWRRNGWKTTGRGPVKNQDLWRRLDDFVQGHTIEFVWLKGHAGYIDNERADQLANHAIEKGLSGSSSREYVGHTSCVSSFLTSVSTEESSTPFLFEESSQLPLATPDKYRIKRALISVFDKSTLLPFVRFLVQQGVMLLSTGGSAQYLQEAGFSITKLEEYTNFPEILGGRVKSLHPRVHAGLLARRDYQTHLKDLQIHGIPPIDLVVVNLYPFTETIARNDDFDACIEMIDIGGCTLIRSAAKNHAFVTVVVDPDDYTQVIEAMEMFQGSTPLGLRKRLAQKAFTHCATYDTAIAQWMERMEDPQQSTFPTSQVLVLKKHSSLRYGENPHQKAALYTLPFVNSGSGVASAVQTQGKPLSYNNINDTEAAYSLISEFEEPAVAFIKHATPCGVAENALLIEAYRKALACDPVSAYGGIVACNRPIDEVTAAEMVKMFLEVIIAPEVEETAYTVLARRKALRVLTTHSIPRLSVQETLSYHSITGGFLVQSQDNLPITRLELQTVTKREPSPTELQDLLFAFKTVRHVKSNAVVFVRDRTTVGIGSGQTSRVDSVRLAILKKPEGGSGFVVASDAFFPFADGVILAARAGATAIIQSGGSIRDQEVIAAADQHNMAMVFTKTRHFRH